MAKKKQPQETYMAIRLSLSKQWYVPSNRYIRWIDEHWYETTDTPIRCVPEKELDKVKGYLKSHFINHAAFIYPNGTEEVWNAFKQTKQRQSKVKLTIGKGFSFVFGKKTK